MLSIEKNVGEEVMKLIGLKLDADIPIVTERFISRRGVCYGNV